MMRLLIVAIIVGLLSESIYKADGAPSSRSTPKGSSESSTKEGKAVDGSKQKASTESVSKDGKVVDGRKQKFSTESCLIGGKDVAGISKADGAPSSRSTPKGSRESSTKEGKAVDGSKQKNHTESVSKDGKDIDGNKQKASTESVTKDGKDIDGRKKKNSSESPIKGGKDVDECWTKWFDRDDPSATGDWETLSSLRKENPGKICPRPTAIEAKTLSGLSVAEAGEVIYKNDTTSGFICRNKDQIKDKKCSDYRVRFSCHLPFCGRGV